MVVAKRSSTHQNYRGYTSCDHTGHKKINELAGSQSFEEAFKSFIETEL